VKPKIKSQKIYNHIGNESSKPQAVKSVGSKSQSQTVLQEQLKVLKIVSKKFTSPGQPSVEKEKRHLYKNPSHFCLLLCEKRKY
jgi:hypothetical protein